MISLHLPGLDAALERRLSQSPERADAQFSTLWMDAVQAE
jgi:hypothetical protein